MGLRSWLWGRPGGGGDVTAAVPFAEVGLLGRAGLGQGGAGSTRPQGVLPQGALPLWSQARSGVLGAPAGAGCRPGVQWCPSGAGCGHLGRGLYCCALWPLNVASCASRVRASLLRGRVRTGSNSCSCPRPPQALVAQAWRVGRHGTAVWLPGTGPRWVQVTPWSDAGVGGGQHAHLWGAPQDWLAPILLSG